MRENVKIVLDRKSGSRLLYPDIRSRIDTNSKRKLSLNSELRRERERERFTRNMGRKKMREPTLSSVILLASHTYRT